MLNFKHLVNLTSKIIRKCEFQSRLQNEKIFASKCGFFNIQKQNFHTSTPCCGVRNVTLEYRKAQKEAVKKTAVQGIFQGNILQMRDDGYFPTHDLPNRLFDGVPFKEIPILNVRVSRNNTIISLSEKGLVKMIRSCGVDGFKNAKKGTNVAAQATGVAMALRAIKKGFKTVRLVIKGLGPGRLSVVKGLQLGGLNIVSVTDTTMDYSTLRPRKQRRL